VFNNAKQIIEEQSIISFKNKPLRNIERRIKLKKIRLIIHVLMVVGFCYALFKVLSIFSFIVYIFYKFYNLFSFIFIIKYISINYELYIASVRGFS